MEALLQISAAVVGGFLGMWVAGKIIDIIEGA